MTLAWAPTGALMDLLVRAVSAHYFVVWRKRRYPQWTMAARATGSATICFGLVSIPVKLYTATSPQGISFNMLHEKCGGRMKQQYFCPIDNQIVERKEMVRGFEHAKEQYVTFTEEELEKLESSRADEIELIEFVPLSQVDPLYFEKSYYLGPDNKGEKGYRLLSESMEQTKTVALGRHYTRGRGNLVLIRPFRGGLMLQNLFYGEEVRDFDEVPHGGAFEFHPIERQLAEKLIKELFADTFDADTFRDDYVDRVQAAIDAKVAGQEVKAEPKGAKPQVIDLLEALQKSVVKARDRSIKPPAKAGPKKSAMDEGEESAPQATERKRKASR
jgi:DNA end-binding protein Ku